MLIFIRRGRVTPLIRGDVAGPILGVDGTSMEMRIEAPRAEQGHRSDTNDRINDNEPASVPNKFPLRWLWRAAFLPLFMLLVILEPVVTFILAGLALLGLLTTLFFEIFGAPGFPVWIMLSLSLGLAIALIPYHALIRALSNAYR